MTEPAPESSHSGGRWAPGPTLDDWSRLGRSPSQLLGRGHQLDPFGLLDGDDTGELVQVEQLLDGSPDDAGQGGRVEAVLRKCHRP